MSRMMSRALFGSESVTVPREMSQLADLAHPDAAHLVSGRDLAQLGHTLGALVDRELAAVMEAAAVRARSRGRCPAWDTAQGAGLAQMGDRVEQRARVGVRGRGEDRVALTELGDLAGVHHRYPVGDVGDHGQVVGDVERGDAVSTAELTHRPQHHALGGDVEPGGRLVEHEHLGLGQEGHRQCDALHLTTGELVGVATHELVVVGEADLGQAVPGTLQPALRRAETAQLHQLDDLLADPDAGVQGGGGVLRDVGDLLAAQLAHLLPGQAEDLPVLEDDGAALELRAGSGVAQHGSADGGLAAARLTDEADHLTGLEHQVDVVDDIDVLAAAQHDAKTLHGDAAAGALHRGLLGGSAHESSPPRSLTWAIPSAVRLVPMVNRPMMSTGASTDKA